MKKIIRDSVHGKLLVCKFCRAEVWFDFDGRRFYDVDSDKLHVESCEKRRSYYGGISARVVDERRRGKSR